MTVRTFINKLSLANKWLLNISKLMFDPLFSSFHSTLLGGKFTQLVNNYLQEMTWADSADSRQRVFFLQSSKYFIGGHTNLPREASGPNGSNCFSSGGPYQYF